MNDKIARILIVDDNPEIHKDFKKIFANENTVDENFSELADLFGDSDDSTGGQVELNFEIDSAFQGEEAIEMIRQSVNEGRPYSLAFVDVRMPPGIDGIETTQRLWEIDPELQVVICSAYSDYSWQEIVAKLKHTDQFLILKKPFELIEVQQLANALHHRWVDARHDNLTGLTNRQAFVEYFRRQMRLAQDEGTSLSCVMIDIDFLKRVNDLHGQTAGDAALQQLANVLSRLCRDGDHVCRYGGEEFCVLLRGADENFGCEWAERTRLALLETPISTADGNSICITASFGVAQLTPTLTTPEELFAQADVALRHAKQLGRDRVGRFTIASTEKPESIVRNVHRPFFSIRTCDLMQPAKVIGRDATLRDAAALLIEHGITAAPVVDDQGVMVGVLTERDLLRVFSNQADGKGEVCKAMRASVVGFSEETNLQEIFEFVVRVSIPQVVIVRNGRPCGTIGRKALLEWLHSNGFGDESDDGACPPNAVAQIGTMPTIEMNSTSDASVS